MARIADVWAVIPRGTNEPQDWRTAMAQILVVVEADDGTRGFGVGGGGKAGIHVIDTVLREVVVGQDPRDVEAIWQQMYRATHHFGRKGLAVMALSGLDLAIWDLLGKLEDKPVYELLGGLRHERVPGYASLGATVGSAVEQGFQHVKLHLPGVKNDPQEIVDLVRAGRDAVMTKCAADQRRELTGKHHHRRFECRSIGDSPAGHDLRLEAESPHQRAGLRSTTVNHHDANSQRVQQRHLGCDVVERPCIGQHVTTQLDDEGSISVGADVTQRPLQPRKSRLRCRCHRRVSRARVNSSAR